MKRAIQSVDGRYQQSTDRARVAVDRCTNSDGSQPHNRMAEWKHTCLGPEGKIEYGSNLRAGGGLGAAENARMCAETVEARAAFATLANCDCRHIALRNRIACNEELVDQSRKEDRSQQAKRMNAVERMACYERLRSLKLRAPLLEACCKKTRNKYRRATFRSTYIIFTELEIEEPMNDHQRATHIRRIQ